MRRREFLAMAGAAAVWSRVARAQQGARVPRIAWVSATIPLAEMTTTGHVDAVAFLSELALSGFVEGRTIAIDRYYSSQLIADETARTVTSSAPDLIYLSGAAGNSLATIALTKTIPIVSRSGDPLGQGIVNNLARPGGNVTGIATTASSQSEAKVLSVLAEAIPSGRRVAYIGAGPEGQLAPAQKGYVDSALDAASRLGLSMVTAFARVPANERTFREAFAVAAASRSEMVQFGLHSEINTAASTIAKLSIEARLPAISPYSSFPRAGGLLSYGSNSPDNERKAARYVALILQGAKPGDLPVLQPTVFDLVVNLAAAKAIGVDIPVSVLAQATEVVE